MKKLLPILLLLFLAACAKAPAAEPPSDAPSEPEVSEVYEGLSEEGKQAYLLAREAEASAAYQLLVAAVEADAALQAVYGGAYIGDAAQLRDLVICLTEDDEATREAYRAVLDGYEPRFQRVTYTEQELTAAMRLALARVETARATGELDFEAGGIGVRVAWNCVYFMVSDPQAAAQLCEDILPGGFAYVDNENEVYRP